MCERFGVPVIGTVICQVITIWHLQKIVNAARPGAMRGALARAETGDAGTAGQDSPRELFEAVGLTF